MIFVKVKSKKKVELDNLRQCFVNKMHRDHHEYNKMRKSKCGCHKQEILAKYMKMKAKGNKNLRFTNKGKTTYIYLNKKSKEDNMEKHFLQKLFVSTSIVFAKV